MPLPLLDANKQSIRILRLVFQLCHLASIICFRHCQIFGACCAWLLPMHQPNITWPKITLANIFRPSVTFTGVYGPHVQLSSFPSFFTQQFAWEFQSASCHSWIELSALLCVFVCVCVYYDMYFWRLTHRMATTDWSEELRFLISLLNWCHCIFFPCFCCYCSFRHPLPDKLSLAMMEYRYGIFVVIAG